MLELISSGLLKDFRIDKQSFPFDHKMMPKNFYKKKTIIETKFDSNLFFLKAILCIDANIAIRVYNLVQKDRNVSYLGVKYSQF